MAAKQLKAKVTTAGSNVRKADTKTLITGTIEGFPEDAFTGQYYVAGTEMGTGVAILAPQFQPGTLYSLITQNNTLAQCVEAMEVNIDGTGHSIDLIEDAKENEAEKQILKDFFDEPYPGKSMIAIRRAVRRDLETTGNGYVEVIRNAGDEILMLNHADSTITRLLMLDAPAESERVLRRAGKDMKVKMLMRDRRFVQELNGKRTYFKQFGATRDLDRDTGQWANKGRLPVEKRASEMLHFIGNKEPKTPYGSPRWVNQMPSILGSRKAEEHNLEFFDAGGLPPVMVIVQGGTLGETVTEQLQAHLSGKGSQHRAAIVEAVSTSGSLDSAGSVQVKVERFGCLTSDHEVLTLGRGWVPISDWDGDAVATVRGGALLYDTPLAYHVYDYDGDMVHIEGAATEFMVTPNHRVWYKQPRDGAMRFEFARSSVDRSNLVVPVAPEHGYDGVTQLNFLVAGATYAQDTWLDFLGMFIADGSTNGHESNPNTISISVKKARKKEFLATFMPVVAAEAGAGYSQHDYDDGYTRYSIFDSALRNWLREIVGATAAQKRVPPAFLQLNQPQSERLLQAMLQGDGHYNGEEGRHGWTYTTVSPGLANDVQTLALHAGYRSVLTKVKEREEYCISLTQKTTAHVTKGKSPFWGYVPYTGKVYCFTMPTGVFVTRRNGKVCITGNSERQQDAMFQGYDKAAETHVRTAFRLPPLFTGHASDFSFATAYASYLVAEAQVFWPEREEFDDVINKTVVKVLGVRSYRFRSLPLSMVDVANQLKALEMVSEKAISGEELVSKLNEIVGLGMQYEKQEAPPAPQGKIDPLTGLPYTQPASPPPHTPVEDGKTLPEAKDQAGIGNKAGDPGGVRKADIAASVAAVLDHYAKQVGVEELCSCADHLAHEANNVH